MFVPENKFCPMSFSNPANPGCCFGTLCAWFDEAVGKCGVLSSRVVETVKPYLASVPDLEPVPEEPVVKPKRTRKKAEA